MGSSIKKFASGRLAFAITVLLTAMLSATPARSQVLYGSLVGNVTDQNGASVPGATVTLTNKGTGQTREATTNENGEYSVINLLPGVYDIKVTKQGFSTHTQIDQNVAANNALRVDISMKLGNVNDVVSVAADATVLQTESATVKSEISAKEIQSLPISAYRNYQSLINLVPGTIPAGFQNANTDTPERSLTTNVNGTARNNNNTRLDGAASVNVWLPHHAAYVAPSESVQEVNISTNNFDAEQGLAGGAAIQVITKSGTNDFHGAAFAYHDNHFFRAKNVFQPLTLGTNKPKNLRTIPGATLGGPIIKDKLFFFGSWEGMFERAIRDGFFTVPDAAVRAGNFAGLSTIYDPLTGTIDGFDRTAFLGNVIPAARISPVATELLKRVPLPNLFEADGRARVASNYYSSAPQIFDRNNFDGKVNWNRNERHQIWTKISHMRAAVSGSYALGEAGGPCVCDGGSGTGDTHSYVGSIGHTWTLGSGFIIDGNFSVTNRSQSVIPPDYGQNIGTDILKIPGVNGPDIRQSGLPQFNFGTGYTNYGNQNGWVPMFRDERSFTFSHNATKLVGSHDFRFGADIVRHALNHWQPEIGVGPRGAFTFTGNETVLRRTTGTTAPTQYNAFAAFLLGTPQRAEKSLQYEKMTTREWQMGFYFRDRWQVNRNLTVTLGLRYELFPMMHRADRGIELLDLNSPIQLNSAGQPNGVMQVLIGGKGNNDSSVGVDSSKKLFAPRLGFAWRVNDDTVVRGGYGITYDPGPFGRPLRGFYPLTIAQTFIATAPGANETFTPWGFNADVAGNRGLGVAVGIPAFTGPDLSSGIVNLPGTVQMRSPYEGTLKRGYIQSWNLMIERKLIKDIKVEIGYVSTATRNQFGDLNLNAAQTPSSQRFLQQKYGRTADTLLWNGFTSAGYHSLQVAVNRRYSNGLFIKGAYTWSKAYNYFDDSGWAGLALFNATSQIGRNRALAGYDIPHTFQTGAAYELPFGKGKKWVSEGVTSKVVGGWSVSGIGSIVAGRPLTITAAASSLDAPGNTQTPDLVGKISYPKGIGPGKYWFDPTVFRPVDFDPAYLANGVKRFGTLGRNVARAPGFGNLDLSFIRNFKFTERVNMDFRVDVFNFTNTPHYVNAPPNSNRFNSLNASAPSRDAAGNILTNADGTLRLNGFGQILSADQDQRQFRFGIRFGF